MTVISDLETRGRADESYTKIGREESSEERVKRRDERDDI